MRTGDRRMLKNYDNSRGGLEMMMIQIHGLICCQKFPKALLYERP